LLLQTEVVTILILSGKSQYVERDGIFIFGVLLRMGRVTRDRCYDFLNIFAEKFSKKIGVFDSKQS
jgi:hypothetical protein